MVPGWRARLVSVMLACALPLGNGATAATPMPPSAATMATTVTTARDDPAVTGRFHTLWLKLRGEDGFLGKPLADRRCNERRSRCTQRFAGGTITWRTGHPVAVRATSQTSSVLVVVNKRRPLNPRSYQPAKLRTVKGSNQRMRPGAARALEKLLKAAAADGNPLGVRSGYRSFATQRSVYARWVRTYGKARAERISARGVLGAPDGTRRRRPRPLRCRAYLRVVRPDPPGAVGRPQRAPVRVHRPLPGGAGEDHRLHGRAVAPALCGSGAREGHEEGRVAQPRGALRPAGRTSLPVDGTS